MKVPFFDVQYNLGDEDKRAILSRWEALLDHGAFVNGPEIAELESALSAFLGVSHAVACSNGSDALVLALRACDIGPGDEVLLPSFTFFATAGAVSRIGATPVFVDIDADTFLMSTESAVAKTTSKTAALLPVHLYGYPLDIAPLRAAVEAKAGHSVRVVEDAAQAVGAIHESGPCGALGDVGSFSCYPTKNLGATGDAGFVTTADADLADRMRALRQHGGGRRYFHDEVGFNFRQSGLQAAALLHHLPRLPEFNAARRQGAEHYGQLIQELGLTDHVKAPLTHPGHVFHQYVIRTNRRDELQAFLSEAGVGSAVFYPLALHLQPCFAHLGGQEGDLPQAERATQEVLALPIYPGVTEEQRKFVMKTVASFFEAN